MTNNPVEFEQKTVHQVYDQIAEHFTKTRYRVWPGVKRFLNQVDPCDVLLDIGCGNGKNIIQHQGIHSIGLDRCVRLVETCRARQLETTISDMLPLPFISDTLDVILCIATLHHLSTKERRLEALREMGRVLRHGGHCLIYVWAVDESNHIGEQSLNENSHWVNTKARQKMRFLDASQQDALIPWVVIPHEKKDKGNETTQNVKETNRIVERYYHLYRFGELEEECQASQCFDIEQSYYEQSNWCVVLKKR
eukprot:jgi/Galph1/5353/GphlegSOOS_G3948.1